MLGGKKRAKSAGSQEKVKKGGKLFFQKIIFLKNFLKNFRKIRKNAQKFMRLSESGVVFIVKELSRETAGKCEKVVD